MRQRPRRNRKNTSLRSLVQENHLRPDDFVWPVFVKEGKGESEPIGAMPGCFRMSLDVLVEKAKEAYSLGVPGLALFPVIEDAKKNSLATESHNSEGLMQKSILEIKSAVPEMLIFSDVAMDPYSSDGHDGVVQDGQILNDPTLEILAKMAISQAEAGADFVAPSDMMDGRVGYIRHCLDEQGFTGVGIMSYAAKYASAFYGPFRDALDSNPRFGDKKTYQMNPANQLEAIREVELDIDEGADMVMVKPALSYLDVIARVSDISTIPVAAYNVSGEYSMIVAASEQGYLDRDKAMLEMLLSIKRAGAKVLFSYFAVEAAKLIN